MTNNNHPANGPVSLDRLHQISEILSKASAQSDGGNLGYAMADAVKVIDGAIAAFGTEPVAWKSVFRLTGQPVSDFEKIFENREAMDTVVSLHERGVFNVTVTPLYAALPAPVVPDEIKHRIGGLDWGWEGEFNRGWNACRSAMLQAGNSPATPDGWIPVSELMPPQGVPLLVCSGNGVVQRTVYGFDGENWLDWYEQYDPVKAELDDLWQPLPAAPQQEVKSE
ncbi:DUF551 domain-containing protein [Citrobacter werkmanii]|uniref:DUF551 domain-containing protein n=1 Tax=Citrobacter werkmanii TaxID=67827 RepID=UPI001900B967|nr:DUF551 domain-containing protein [Citrobacter werkmanii]MBJ9293573.1 DUF551 domain-containing protein [Citrobacter werkmanii]